MGRIGGISGEPSALLRAFLVARGFIDPSLSWTPLVGGRTNLLWRLDGPGGPLTCKLSLRDRETPLFPNDPHAEHTALVALSETGLTPELRTSFPTPMGNCTLLAYLPGETWHFNPEPVGRMLARLHRQPAPPGLRTVPGGDTEILAQGDAMLRSLDRGDQADLKRLRPAAAERGPLEPVFLHGDPVPGNIVMHDGAPVLIDWQCPACGDPLHDLCLFLSPAMQRLSGRAPLSNKERAAFLAGYGDFAIEQRLTRAEPAHLWRMMVYCQWRIAGGDPGYIAAFRAESERLKQIGQDKTGRSRTGA